jgi:hypothetical protein
VVKSGFTIARKKMEPALIFMVFIFGNLPDATHMGWFRDLTHNPAGTVLFCLVWALIFKRLGVLKKDDMPVVMGAGVIHAAGDLIHGGYLPFYPFSGAVYYYRPWNSVEDLLFETVLAVIMIAVLLRSRDWSELSDFAAEQRQRFFREFRWNRPFRTGFVYAYLFIAFYLMLVGQFVFYIVWKQARSLMAHDIYSWSFLAAFALFITAISAMAFGSGASRKTGS